MVISIESIKGMSAAQARAALTVLEKSLIAKTIEGQAMIAAARVKATVPPPPPKARG